MIREKMAQLILEAGLAVIRSDALKLIKGFPEDVLPVENKYAVFVSNYDFTMNMKLTHKLMRMANDGILVILGTKKAPKLPEWQLDVEYC